MGIKDEHYFNGVEALYIEFEELFQLYNQAALDKAIVCKYFFSVIKSLAQLVHCMYNYPHTILCRLKIRECKGKIYDIGFINPNTVNEYTVQKTPMILSKTC